MAMRPDGERGKLTRKRQYHGLSKHKFFNTYQAMIQRCTFPWNRNYKYYGARGIKVCDSWLNDAQKFLDDMGDKPGDNYELDRINPDDGYYKENCRWLTKSQNKKAQRHFKKGSVSILGYIRVHKALLCKKCLKRCREST